MIVFLNTREVFMYRNRNIERLTHIYYYILKQGESNGKLPLRTCPGCSVSEPYWSPDWFWFLPNQPKG
jgi:hypothetical protein